MKKLKIKKHVLPVLVMAICLLTIVTSTVTLNLKKENKELLHLNYVSNTIISKDQAVINTTTKVISPYVDQSVQIGKNYYDYKGTQEDQEKAIIYHENTYIQNSGVDFMHDNQFEVISILDGTNWSLTFSHASLSHCNLLTAYSKFITSVVNTPIFDVLLAPLIDVL